MNWLRPIPALGSAMVISLALAACASATPAASGGPVASTEPVASTASTASTEPAAGGGGGDLSKVDACALLTPAEIHDATGVDVQAGVNADSDIVKQCNWENSDSVLALGVVVRTFTDDDWDTIKVFPNAEAVPGLGEEAYKNSPLTGDLSVKADGYEIDMGWAASGPMSQADADTAIESLARLVLSRL